MIDLEYIVIIGNAWCNQTGIGINYSWDGARFNNRNNAIRHGFKARGSDDFNVGVLYGDDLVSFDWMDRPTGENAETMAEIAQSIGLRYSDAACAQSAKARGEAA